MAKRRAIIIHGDGRVWLADDKTTAATSTYNSKGTAYDLDKAMQNGAKLVDTPIPIGQHGTAILLFIDEG